MAGRNRMESREAYFNMDDPEDVLALNFPPTETERQPTDRYVECDQFATNSFLYPANIDIRDYQYEISQACFYHNTLVCLPTGAGKTLIAAVVMMNFRRWYPSGKIIFMATTCALVNQQMDACSSFTNIAESDIVELMGKTCVSSRRKDIWESKSVIFATPQVVQNDIKKGRLDPTKIVLLIFDEAHHARGSQAYCNIVRMVAERTNQFRVVGLSATPGNDIISIQAVIFNLMISKIIFKDETDPDIAKYQQKTDIQIVTVPLGSDEVALNEHLGRCISFVAGPLKTRGVLSTADAKVLTKGRVWYEMDQFKKRSGGTREFFLAVNQFSVLMSLTAMQDKLTKYGTASLHESLTDFQIKQKETDVKKRLVDTPDFQALLRFSEKVKRQTHPKLAKLCVILEEFFTENPESRAMVFVQLRAVAYEISNHLTKLPCVKPSVFIGKADTRQNSGLDGELQHEVVSLFRKGNINCIVATSVGEEGLDVGEVDLIVCYDTPSSPLKNVQRMGRTGRKRSGRVIFLMSEGYEEKSLEKAQNSRSFIRNKLTAQLSRFCLYKPETPNMPLPEDLRVIKIRCVHQTKKKIEVSLGENKMLLSKREYHAMKCCYGQILKYKRVKIHSQKNRCNEDSILFTHSAESFILHSLKSKREKELEIPNEIEAEVSRLFASQHSQTDAPVPPPAGGLFALSDDEMSDDDATPNQPCTPMKDFRFDIDYSDDSQEPDEPCAPTRNFLFDTDSDEIEDDPQPAAVGFLDDSDIDISISGDDDDIVLSMKHRNPVFETPASIDIGSDSDIDDIDVDALEVPNTPKRIQILLDSDDDIAPFSIPH